MAHRFHRLAFGKIAAAAAVRAHAGKKIGSDRYVARRRNLVSQILNPVRHAEDFVDDQHDRRLALRFGINDKRLDCAAVVLDGYPLPMTWRFSKRSLGPVMRGSELRGGK